MGRGRWSVKLGPPFRETCLLGIVGAIVGGYVFRMFGASGVSGLNIYSLNRCGDRLDRVLGYLPRDKGGYVKSLRRELSTTLNEPSITIAPRIRVLLAKRE